MSISLYYLATIIYILIYCYIVQIMLYLCCRSLVDLVGHVLDHMIIETSTEMNFEG